MCNDMTMFSSGVHNDFTEVGPCILDPVGLDLLYINRIVPFSSCKVRLVYLFVSASSEAHMCSCQVALCGRCFGIVHSASWLCLNL
jgi:hypothetical protein